MELDQRIANHIMQNVGGAGQPPEVGFQEFTAGLDPYLSVIRDEYLRTYVKDGGSAFKMVVGVYGGGKTHFLYCVRDAAWQEAFVTSYVSLSQAASPFHKFELVYGAIMHEVTPPLEPEELLAGGYERGIGAFIRRWYSRDLREATESGLSGQELQVELLSQLDMIRGLDSISFEKAVKSAYRALLGRHEDEFGAICQWLSGEGYDRRTHSKFGILQKIDKTTVATMLRSFAQLLRQIGYSGLVVLFDEAERIPSMSGKQKEQHLSNLRELIDACSRTSLQGAFIFYAVPDEQFLEGGTQVYTALQQRVATVFDLPNYAGVKIELENTVVEPPAFLREVGGKLVRVFEVAKSTTLDKRKAEELVGLVATEAYEQRFGDISYKRVFVQGLARGLNYWHHTGSPPSITDLGW